MGSFFQRVQLIQWKQINGFSVVAMEQFQLHEKFEATVAEIRELKPKLFKKASTKCPIYREADPKTIIENDAQYQFWMMNNPTKLYFQCIESQTQSGCCLIL